jgi:hypothetical protein
MVLELGCFLGGTLIFILPGIFIAAWIGLGKNNFDRITYGSSLGIGLTVYLASLISHFNLLWFYPIWTAIGLISLIGYFFGRKNNALEKNSPVIGWMIVVLLLVAITRFAAALPHLLPRGEFDPSFHMILAKKIQLTQHAIFDWSPFETAQLNYPTGSHVLIVVLAAVARLPLETIFKNLIPLLGILSTAQIFVFAKNTVKDDTASLCAAAAYGLWAVGGSINYYNWGGLPNELGMLLLMAMLSAWLENSTKISFGGAMAVFFAGMILAHHHVMIAGGAILAVAIVWQMFRPTPTTNWKLLFYSALVGCALDLFFLIPYVTRIATLHSTGVLSNGESPVDFWSLADSLGYVFGIFAMGGLVLWVARRNIFCHPLVICACIAMLGLFVACEYVWPMILRWRHQPPVNAFTPTRFLADMNYFLAVFAGLMMARIFDQRLHLKKISMIILIGLAGLTLLPLWKEQSTPVDVPDGYIRACYWINANTSPDTIVMSHVRKHNPGPFDRDDVWTPYLAWRRGSHTPMPISEPQENNHPQLHRVPLILSGQISPDSPDQKIVEIILRPDYAGQPVLWQDDSNIMVIQLWPLVATTHS